MANGVTLEPDVFASKPDNYPGVIKQGVILAQGLEIIIGPMFAGKTSALIDRLTTFEQMGYKVICFFPCFSNRYGGVDKIISHNPLDGSATKSFPAHPLLELDWNIPVGDHDVIGVDEIHMFESNQIVSIIDMLASMQRRVIVSGLACSYERKPFLSVCSLIGLADVITQLRTTCVSCESSQVPLDFQPVPLDGGNAVFSMRIKPIAEDQISNSPALLVGGMEEYKPICLFFFFNEDPTTLGLLLSRRSKFSPSLDVIPVVPLSLLNSNIRLGRLIGQT